MKRYFFTLIAISVMLTACGGVESKPQTMEQTAPPKYGEEIAVMKTNKGVIKIKFFPQYTPETVKNFTELSKKGFYNNLTFHRVIPNFMIQGGDPLGNGTGGETYKGPGETLPDEFTDKLSNIRGALSMANRGPNTGTSQFFIVQNKDGATFLNGRHTVFGQVFEGIDIVDKIVYSPTGPNDKPKEPIVMESVTIEKIP